MFLLKERLYKDDQKLFMPLLSIGYKYIELKLTHLYKH